MEPGAFCWHLLLCCDLRRTLVVFAISLALSLPLALSLSLSPPPSPSPSLFLYLSLYLSLSRFGCPHSVDYVWPAQFHGWVETCPQ